MPNALDYIDWRGDLSFGVSSLCEADEVLFALIGKPDLTGFVPAAARTVPLRETFAQYYAALAFSGKKVRYTSPNTAAMLEKLFRAERYRDLGLAMFRKKLVPERTEQFSALTVRLNGINYVTFRGTDSSLIGWKEDFRLAAQTGIPAQLDAEQYLTEAAEAFEGPIIVSGHSKGGNLAVWSAVHAPEPVRDRIIRVVSYDGPGFPADFLKDPACLTLSHKIVSVVPEHSVIGMILHHAGTQRIVRAETSGVSGHDPLSWEMDRTGLLPAEALSDTSVSFHDTLDDVFSHMDQQQLDALVDGIFSVIDASGATVISDFSNGTLAKMLATARKIGHEREVYVFMKALLGGTIRRSSLSKLDRFRPDSRRGKEAHDHA